jgi:hypothetical protein
MRSAFSMPGTGMEHTWKRNLRPVETSHLSKAIDDLICAGPLDAGREVLRFRVQVRAGVVEDEVSVRLVVSECQSRHNTHLEVANPTLKQRCENSHSGSSLGRRPRHAAAGRTRTVAASNSPTTTASHALCTPFRWMPSPNPRACRHPRQHSTQTLGPETRHIWL